MPGATRSASAAAADGRVQRGERTRDAIADALLSLLADGVARPTAREIAARADVSLRSVFQHFDDMESLYAMCVTRQQARVAGLSAPIDPSGSFDARVDGLVAQRARLYEHVAPVRRVALREAPSSPVLQEALAAMRRAQRADLTSVFGPELGARAPRALVAALEVATSFETWDQLRRVQGLSAATARAAVRSLVCGLLR